MNKTYSISFIIFIILILGVGAEVPSLKPCLNDQYGLISSVNAEKIFGLCDELESETGVQAAILIINITEDIDEYAVSVFDKNKIGEKDKDNGFLIVIDPTDNDWIILVGYGLEGVLNDAKLADIGRNYLEPEIMEGNYGDAVYYTLGIIAMDIYDSGEFRKEKNFWNDNWRTIIAVLILILIIIITKGRIIFLPNIIKGFGGGRTGGGRGKK